jgi:hypothetical protein
MSKLADYQSKTPEFQKLPEGVQKVRLVSYKETDSFHNYDGSLKNELPEWANPCEQLAITVVSTSGKGGLTHRLNMEGYVKFSELTTEEVKSGKFTDVNGYACAKNKSGKLVRIVDEGKTKTCENILDQAFAAIGMEEGSGVADLDTAIADKKEFDILVVNEPYEGADQLRIKSFRKIKADATGKVEVE